MKTFLIVAAWSLLFAATAYAATRYLAVSGAGMGTDTDQSSAHSQADSAAQANLQSACPGELTNVRKIFDQCSQISDNWVCNINYSATCQF